MTILQRLTQRDEATAVPVLFGQFDDSVELVDSTSSASPKENPVFTAVETFEQALETGDLRSALCCAIQINHQVFSGNLRSHPALLVRVKACMARLFSACALLLDSPLNGKEMILLALGRLNQYLLEEEQQVQLLGWQKQHCQKAIPEIPRPFDHDENSPDKVLVRLITYSLYCESLIERDRQAVLAERFTWLIGGIILCFSKEPHISPENVWEYLKIKVFPCLHLISVVNGDAAVTSCQHHLQTLIFRVTKTLLEQNQDASLSHEKAEEYNSIVSYCQKKQCLTRFQLNELRDVLNKKKDNKSLNKEDDECQFYALREKCQQQLEVLDHEQLLKDCLASRREKPHLWSGKNAAVLGGFLKQALMFELSKLCLSVSKNGVRDPDCLLKLNALISDLGNICQFPWIIGRHPYSMLANLRVLAMGQFLIPEVSGKIQDGTEQSLNNAEVILQACKSIFSENKYATLSSEIQQGKQRLEQQLQQQLQLQQKQEQQRIDTAALAESVVPGDVEPVVKSKSPEFGDDAFKAHLKELLADGDKARLFGKEMYEKENYKESWQWMEFIRNYYQNNRIPDNPVQHKTLTGFVSNVAMTALGSCFQRTGRLKGASDDAQRAEGEKIALRVRDEILPLLRIFPHLDPYNSRGSQGILKSFNSICSALYKLYLSPLHQEVKQQQDLLKQSGHKKDLDPLRETLVAIHPWIELLNKKTRDTMTEYFHRYFSCEFGSMHSALESENPKTVLYTLQVIERKIVDCHRFFELSPRVELCSYARKVVGHGKRMIAEMMSAHLNCMEELIRLKNKFEEVSFPVRDDEKVAAPRKVHRGGRGGHDDKQHHPRSARGRGQGQSF